jgi:hypothetical protein
MDTEIQNKIETYKFTKEFKEKIFGKGEWVDEPDVVIFEYKGYKCIVERIAKQEPFCKEEHWYGGYLCGYVVVPKQHKSYGAAEIVIVCHGGLTFSDMVIGLFAEDIGVDSYHLIGFDCAHSHDYCPSMKKFRAEQMTYLQEMGISKESQLSQLFNPVYRTVEFCIDECKSIVEQLIDLEGNNED